MALQIPRAGLQLEEGVFDHLPTQSFILDLSDDVIEGMIESVNQGNEIRLSLGNKPTFIYGSSSYHIEPTFEDETDDIELFLESNDSSKRAERLPQLAMSLFRKPELGNPWAQYRNSSSEDEDEEDYELGSSPEPEDAEQESYDALDSDIALLRDSMAQREAEKHEKSTKVIEGGAPAPNGKNGGKRTAGSLQKALSDRRSPFNRSSLSPLPTSPSLSASGSPSLLPADAASQNAADKAKHARSPIIHELAFKEQPYDMLWQKYPGSSEAEFKNALEKVADLDDDTQNYILRKKYWRELDVWRHEYASEEERQQAVDNAVRQFDKMRLSTTEPEWEKLLPREERGQGKILSKVQVSIAKGTSAPKIRVQKADDASGDSGNGGSNDSSEGGNGSGSNRTDEEGGDSEVTLSPSRQTTTTKKKMTAREAQEKRLLSTKKKSPPTSAPARSTSPATTTKVSPAKSAAARASNNDKMGKFKSKEFVSESDSSDSESESVPLSASVHHQAKLAANSVKPLSKPSTAKVSSAATASKDRAHKDDDRATPSAAAARKAKPSPVKETVKALLPPKPPLKKRARDQDDDDSSSSSSSGTPLSKRIKPLKSAPKASSTLRDAREKQRPPQPPAQPPSARVSNISPNESSSSNSSSGGGGGHSNMNGNGSSSANGGSSSKSKNNTSPVKSSPLASSPPTNASELDLSSEESVPPIGTTNTSRKRKMVDDHRNNLKTAEATTNGTKLKKRRNLPEDLVDKAVRFKVYYEKYEALYRDIASRTNPPKERVAELLKMHNRLQEMKSDIHHEAMIQRA
ncbi:hypothetical protein SEUCBS139899_000028 [Sporothrix eucalyptigena]|uniref:RNA polymerase II elongation factor ELL N-terminal domain-containing protein n=1 Tax=Sporothrix eucalyptigena TaxID=1812306 RepID=A0ABP0AQY7_9PEZI